MEKSYKEERDMKEKYSVSFNLEGSENTIGYAEFDTLEQLHDGIVEVSKGSMSEKFKELYGDKTIMVQEYKANGLTVRNRTIGVALGEIYGLIDYENNKNKKEGLNYIFDKMTFKDEPYKKFLKIGCHKNCGGESYFQPDIKHIADNFGIEEYSVKIGEPFFCGYCSDTLTSNGLEAPFVKNLLDIAHEKIIEYLKELSENVFENYYEYDVINIYYEDKYREEFNKKCKTQEDRFKEKDFVKFVAEREFMNKISAFNNIEEVLESQDDEWSYGEDEDEN